MFSLLDKSKSRGIIGLMNIYDNYIPGLSATPPPSFFKKITSKQKYGKMIVGVIMHKKGEELELSLFRASSTEPGKYSRDIHSFRAGKWHKFIRKEKLAFEHSS